MRYCEVCGVELPDDWEFDMCEDCMNNLASNVINSDDMFPNEDDF